MSRPSLRRWIASTFILLSGTWWIGVSHAEEDLSPLRGKIDKVLRVDLTRDWYPRSVDRERGGFHQNVRPRLVAAAGWRHVPGVPVPADLDGRRLCPNSPADRARILGYARHGIAFLDTVMRDKESAGFTGSSTRRPSRSQARRRETRLWDLVRHLRGQHGRRGDRRRAGAQGGAGRLRLAGPMLTTPSTAATSRPSAGRHADRHLGRGCHRSTGERPARDLLRVQDDERPHPHAGGRGRALAGRFPAGRQGAAARSLLRSSATGSPSSRVR